MKLNFHWPRTKSNGLNPWYVILWRLLMYPFVFLSGSMFYLTLCMWHCDTYFAEQFRKNYY